MKTRARELGDVVWFSMLALIVLAILTVGILALNGYTMPWWLSIQRQSVEQSKSFVDSSNTTLLSLKSEYVKLETKLTEAKDDSASVKVYRAQQKALVDQMCGIMAAMNKSTVNSDVRSFIELQEGC